MSDSIARPDKTTPGKRLPVLAIVGFCFALSLTAHAQTSPDKPARALYHDYCSVCHGEGGDGRSHAVQGMVPPPRDFTAPGARSGLTRMRMIASVRDGVPGTAMVGWNTQLSQRQIEAIVDYIRERLMAIQPLSTTSGDGETIYAFSCSVCHGEDGTGAVWGSESMDPPPIAFENLHPDRDLPRERMIASVTHGRSGTSMMAFNSQLSPEQIESVVDYVRDAFMSGTPSKEPTVSTTVPTHPESTVGLAVLHGDDQVPRATRPDPDPGAVDPDAPLPFGLVGDPARGGTLFAESCVACHGPRGDGRGPRAYFIYPRPLSFVARENRPRLNRPDLFNSIKHGVRGREMPAWGKVLTDQEVADVAEYVFAAFVATGTAEWDR